VVTIINRIKELRIERGITQEKLAKAIGIARPYLSKIERGDSEPGGAIMLKIADYFGLPAQDIFSNTDDEQAATTA
jgi:putative transcriptional regulator